MRGAHEITPLGVSTAITNNQDKITKAESLSAFVIGYWLFLLSKLLHQLLQRIVARAELFVRQAVEGARDGLVLVVDVL